MFKAFKNHINQRFPFLNNGRVIVAVSGGIDSVVLAHLCHHLNFNVVLAHCNFNLRGAESDADEAFVLKLGSQLDCEVFVQKFNTNHYAKIHGCSIQMAARDLRYQWFADLAAHLKFDYILTAHHADDNLETFLINFTRGTGLNGLTGIPEINGNIVRPLLGYTRAQLHKFAADEAIVWREDASNTSRKYLRNKLRHEVVPLLKSINPQLISAFKNTIAHLGDTADIVTESLDAVAKRAIVQINAQGVTYKISEFKKVNNPSAYLFEMFKDYGFTAWNDVLSLLDAETGKYVSSHTHRLIKHREFLILTDLAKPHHTDVIAVHNNQSSIITPFGAMTFSPVAVAEDNTKDSIYVNSDKLHFPLQIRLWKTSDVFSPLGMTGTKKVSKYLKDQKQSVVAKENTWVLTCNETIIWVIGQRADRRFRVDTNTKTILKISVL